MKHTHVYTYTFSGHNAVFYSVKACGTYINRRSTNFNPLNLEAHLNNIYKFSSYVLSETLHHFESTDINC
jgi:hypothetical protein